MAAKLTKKQKDHMRDIAYNMQYQELFNLHKYLVECPLTDHSVGQGNPVEDAITLFEKLINKPTTTYVSTIEKLENKVNQLVSIITWQPLDTVPEDGTEILLKIRQQNAKGYIVIIAKFGWPTDDYGVSRPAGNEKKSWLIRKGQTIRFDKVWGITPISWQQIPED